ncbi:MAG: chromosome segregation ATPase [Oscillatoriaceae bacterium SKW80]|nr:chromosome segregation ATPase [Oscillatoriaceae bacterium SKYG93]MCX8120853.1 chromosome segregation ATPase [Oscillatoriaceae bacterium SKW80]MDW8454194.1 chromosome segregation ATPase [Oscillatoriaceae cyanobacterium SKYGB_i_bin93]HIK26481.1 chromosome segregation ATPase [Oscillatoriaceae cyanobacterium M7585_C2015_266]
MTKNRQEPARQPVFRFKKPLENSRLPGFPAPTPADFLAGAASEWVISSTLQMHSLDSTSSHEAQTNRRELRRSRRRKRREQLGLMPSPFQPPKNLGSLLKSWKFWVSLTALICGASGAIAVASLLLLPASPNCKGIFWPTASASLRIYCAQEMAEKNTVEDLLAAIALVNALPAEHPLRPEINRNIENWSKQLLDLVESTFQEGKLDEALALARKIPDNVPAYRLVDERIKQWQAIWSKAEEIYKKAETELQRQNWPEVFRQAVQLLDIGNKYWETTKYQELINNLQAAREDGAKLNKAETLAEQGGLENLLEAIKQLSSIGEKSYLYKEAQKLILQFSRQMMDLAQEKLDKRDLEGALSILRKIPDNAKLKEEIKDFTELAKAQAQTWQGTVASLEAAIAAAQKITPNRPLYAKAQELINDWQQSIKELAYLERARNLASSGTISDLKAAISQAELITKSNPRWQEAQEEIARWRSQIEIQEDRPYLDKAILLARSDTPEALQAAINEASRIGSGRALYAEAQEKIEEWIQKLQIQEDRPYLDTAIQLAMSGEPDALQAAIREASKIGRERALYEEAQEQIQEWNRRLQEREDRPYLIQAQNLKNEGRLSEAIAMAQKILPGRALYQEAQDMIQSWQQEVRARQNIDQAYRYASSGTPEMLASAIRIANQVPFESELRAEADTVIDSWSQQILALARERAASNLQEAINIAQKIPTYASAYSAAQRDIQAWQRLLNPPRISSPALTNL